MHHYFLRILFLIILSVFSEYSASAQTNNGMVVGKVKDSSYNFVLSSATVSIYSCKDSSLLGFCIPNGSGEFNVPNLPMNDSVFISVSHVGYHRFIRRFVIPQNKNLIDFEWIYMNRSEKMEEEVMVDITPVRLNGDTLEFNPRAFKTEKHATAEDLMRLLPGFTIWSDGEITFNGKKITALLVDGRPFLGGTDFTAASQNLPKDVLDKVQVYQQRNDKNPFDSTIIANLKLKEDKNFGYFGKVGLGYGSNKRYVSDAMLTKFKKRMQLSVVESANNINKIAGGVDELIRYNSFKGEGSGMNYQSDFSMPGRNNTVALGAKFQYDFSPEQPSQEQERINAHYFLNHHKKNNAGNVLTIHRLSPDSVLNKRSEYLNTNINNTQNLNGSYSKKTLGYHFDLSARGSTGFSRGTATSQEEQQFSGGEMMGSSRVQSKNERRSRSAGLSISLFKNPPLNLSNNLFRRFLAAGTLSYSFNLDDHAGSSQNHSVFNGKHPNNNPRIFDRLYSGQNSSHVGHTLNLSYPHLRQAIFGRKRLANIGMHLGGVFSIHKNGSSVLVLDRNPLTQDYLVNHQLTNERNEVSVNLMPVLSLSKVFLQTLSNRYSKTWSLGFDVKNQFYAFKSQAFQEVQNLRYQYNFVLPQASLNYSNHQFGMYEVKYAASFESNVVYPTLLQLAPLVDSSDYWYIPLANANLAPAKNSKLGFQYNYQSRLPKNPYNISLNGHYRTMRDYIVDSTLYDTLGRRSVYKINSHAHFQEWYTGVALKKSYSPNKSHTFEGTMSYNYSFTIIPLFVNDIFNTSLNSRNNAAFSIQYTFKDLLSLRTQQGISFHSGRQNGLQSYQYTNQYIRFSGTLLLAKDFTLGSYITYHKNSSNNQRSIHFTILNASAGYRFLAGKRGELKFTALDILRQNKNVINTASGNLQTFGYTNVLQQYFMLTMAYYPRKFGK